jgi:hypothetical protein
MVLESPEEFMIMYENAANSRNFDKVGPLVANDAVFFSQTARLQGLET